MQPSDLTAENSHLLDIHKAVTGPLLEAVDTVTRQYQTESEARIAKLQRQEDIVLITKLIVIVLLALVVFWPMVRRIRRDISRLASAEAHTRAIVDNMVDGLISIDEKGIVQSCNPAAERLFGYTAAELPGSNINMLLAESDGRDNDFVAQYCADGKEHLIGVDREVLGQHKDGSTFPVHLAIGAMWLDGNRYFIGIVRDVTDLKQYEQKFIAAREAAELANRAKDSFLATMSHEIRTPLSGMLGMLEVLSLTRLDQDQSDTLKAAWDSGRNLLRIVNDILDWSKIVEGKLALSPSPTSTPRLLQDVVNTYSRIASDKSLILMQRSDPRLSQAHIVDQLRLSQILNNFVSNAIKFTQQHGEIVVQASLLEQVDSGEKIRFSVQDSGAGIPEEQQQRLFQNYQQASADTARLYGGTGLGLAICQRLAELMDGRIELESEPGRGSTFSIILTLPVSGSEDEMMTSVPLEVAQRQVTPLYDDSSIAPTVLAVDDHPINRNLLARQVKLLGLRSETAEDGRVALSLWQGGDFAVVITDCHMPEMDGYALTKAIRDSEAEKQLPHTPIIAWTANALAEEAERCRAAGMDDLLVKPANMSELKRVLQKWLPASGAEGGNIAPVSEEAIDIKAPAPVDLAELGKVVPDASEQKQVLLEFIEQIRIDWNRLLTMLEQGEHIEAQRTAHRMKGSSRMVGAGRLASICETIEQSAQARNLVRARAVSAALPDAIDHIERYISTPGGEL